MANPEHVEIVKQGKAAIEEWRKENPDVRLELEGADLSSADLSGANLSGAKLSDADLSGAELSGAELVRAVLSSADLSDANLIYANLSRAKLTHAVLSSAKLRDADLHSASLSGANLNYANLSRTKLTNADLSSANLSNADLSRSYLGGVNLSGADLSGADLRNAHIDSTAKLDNLQRVFKCRVDRYTMEYMSDHLTQAQKMDLIVTDDIARLRSQYSGVWMWIHVLSLVAFCAPYAWFLAQQWGIARFQDKAHIDAETIALWEATLRHIWNGGIRWREGWNLDVWSFGCFCAVLMYNMIRAVLLMKTKRLETQQEVSGLPVQFSLAGTAAMVFSGPTRLPGGMRKTSESGERQRPLWWKFVGYVIFSMSRLSVSRWLVLYRITIYGYWVMLALVLFNTLHFMSMRVPVALPN